MASALDCQSKDRGFESRRFRFGLETQMAEYRPFKPGDAGSNPAWPTLKVTKPNFCGME